MKKNEAFLHMRIAPMEIADLDDLRRKEADLPTRSEMMRRLIARASGRSGGDSEAKRSVRR